MKTRKTTRLFAITIAVAILLTMFPLSTWAEEITKTVVQSGSCGTNVTYVLYDDGELVISGEGDIYDYINSGSDSPFNGNNSIMNIVIEEGVTGIGTSTFRNCDNAKSIQLPESLTKINNYGIYGCEKLNTINFPNSLEVIGDYNFSFCRELDLKNLVFGNNLQTIGTQAFQECNLIENIYIPASVTTIGDRAFYRCSSISAINVDPNNSNYSSDEFGVLFDKNKTTLFKYPRANIATEYTVPDSVLTIEHSAFEDSFNLTVLNLSDNVTTIYPYAFTGCIGVTELFIPESLTKIGKYTFKSMDSLTHITVDENNQICSSDEYGAFYNKNKTVLSFYPPNSPYTSYKVPETVTTVIDHAFQGVKNLEYVEFTGNISTIPEYAFVGADGPRKIILNEGVKTIGNYAFWDCSNLESIIIPKSLTDIKYNTFWICDNFKYIFYAGSEEEWNSINLPPSNETEFYNASVHYNSTDHTYAETSIDATCTTGGTSTFDCNYCDLSYEGGSVDPLGHESDNNWVQTKAPTCFSEGEEQSKCVRHDDGVTCDTIFTRTVPADNKLHDWGEWKETTPPTCYSEGEATRICNNDNSHIETKVIEIIDHTLGEWTSNYDSTHSKLCQNDKCTYKETENCNFGGWTITKDATDTEEGEKIRICSICTYQETEVIPVDPYANITTEITNGIVRIDGNGSLPTVEAGASHYWDEYAETATAIVIDGEITTIGSNSFTGFSNISTIIIRTPSITIEPDAFVNCPLLENVLIFGNSSFTPESFNGCADAIKVFENADKQHSFTTSGNTINVIPFDFEDTTLQWNGKLTLDAYNFFDIIAAFCNEYDEVKSIKVNSFTGEGFTFYRYNEKTYNSEPIEGNTINNAEFSVLIDSYETGPVYITFNQLCDGITDGSISTFYLIVEDETEGDILDTEVEVKDEEEKSWFEKALEWIVSLLNKLFKILSRFK
ncbi:MAG: leucine-rich repeat protein [Clostridia bacterium]|nr:leucine-rich repeat protein [Clostridia bacterium]MBQ6874384.1 leucine-rich repeat protein [Clostridia bacterium]